MDFDETLQVCHYEDHNEKSAIGINIKKVQYFSFKYN